MSGQAHVSEHDEQVLSYGKYVGGFAASLGLTVTAYVLAMHVVGNRNVLAVILGVLAITQFIVQMLLFLHVREERGTHWKLAAMCMMLLVVLILVFGSLWIMNNLNYRMTPQQELQYMNDEDNL